MLLGYRLARKTINEDSLQQIIKRKITGLHIYNVVFLLFISTFFVITIMFSYIIYYYHIDPANSFGLESSLFLINYWLLPFYTTGLIGYIFGMNTKNKVVYGFLIIIWAMISPSNLNFFMNLFANTELQKVIIWMKNLNFGVYKLDEVYHPFYGFEFNWSKKIGLFLLFLSVFICSIVTFNKKKVRRLYTIIIIISLILFGSIPYNFTKTKINDKDKLFKEYTYYRENPKIPSKDMFDYDIKSMKVEITNDYQFNIKAAVNITNIKQSKIAFTLHRGFIVKNISIPNGYAVSFTQNGDHIEVQLPKGMESQSITLIFNYSGNGTLSNPATNDYIFLPSDFSWLPNNHPYNTRFIFNDDLITSSLQNDNPIKYSLTYKGKNKPEYVNLPKTVEGNYEGVTTGITLISGDLAKVNSNNRDIYYPKSWFIYNEDIKNYVNEYQKILGEYNSIFNTKYSLPKTVILLPNMEMNDPYMYITSVGESSYTVLQINPINFTKTMSINEFIPYQIDSVYGVNNAFSNPVKFARWFTFNSIIGSHMSKNTIQNKRLKEYQKYLAESYIDKKDKKFFDYLFKVDATKIPDEFFVKWKNALLDEDENDWEQIKEIALESGMMY
jgi:hypothetical protein